MFGIGIFEAIILLAIAIGLPVVLLVLIVASGKKKQRP
jgi:hypothetical protein